MYHTDTGKLPRIQEQEHSQASKGPGPRTRKLLETQISPSLVSPLPFYLTLMISIFQLYIASVLQPAQHQHLSVSTPNGLSLCQTSSSARQVRSADTNMAAVAHSCGVVFRARRPGCEDILKMLFQQELVHDLKKRVICFHNENWWHC